MSCSRIQSTAADWTLKEYEKAELCMIRSWYLGSTVEGASDFLYVLRYNDVLLSLFLLVLPGESEFGSTIG